MVKPRAPIHYGWVIAAVGFLIIFACIGLSRPLIKLSGASGC